MAGIAVYELISEQFIPNGCHFLLLLRSSLDSFKCLAVMVDPICQKSVLCKRRTLVRNADVTLSLVLIDSDSVFSSIHEGW